MKKLFLVLVFLSSIFLFQSCSSCERNLNRLYDVNVDLDNDGDRGDLSGDYNPSFKGRGNSCNKPSHHCKGEIDLNRDNYCDNCWDNGYKCHVVDH